ncbi:MAG: hypothetical protein JJU29_12655, partial [Verrucomicrobia bacterium]|nr:hypothetical protein [Verrucomicrobiota bacterium]
HRNQNLLVEIESGGIRRSHLHLHNRMSVRLMRDFGQLQARDADTGRPIPKTYVKVYALGQNGLVSFWKDGYTDARGRFDYLTVNHRKPEEALRFALLILHPDHGAEIRETTPPTR